ncbi:MAG: type I restriction-modification system subunit M [Chloroflexota bacterium]|nr:type I restriction-modification system subunit M [Chloroflexota bacterium]
MSVARISNLSSFTWSIAEILRGDFKQSEYGKVILPFIVLRRLDCLLEPTREAVLAANAKLPEAMDDATRDQILFQVAGNNLRVYNRSDLSFAKIKGQTPTEVHDHLIRYIRLYSGNAQDIFIEKFRFIETLNRLNEGNILWQVFERFAQIDLHPDVVPNGDMGILFEDLIRRFSEISKETAGEHFTPREVISLIVDLVTTPDADVLTQSGIIRRVYDPAAGTGGMLALAEQRIKDYSVSARVELYGQELNPESFGICQSDMLVTGHNPDNIAYGNTLTNDQHAGETFHYLLSNPPYGVDWKKYQEPIKAEHATRGFAGRFGAGLPRVSDGQLLFLMHMISKMRDDGQGSRIGIVMNGSPLFTGGAGSGESEIRRWMLENDWVEAIVALPTDLFYNTGIQTYVWLLTNRKHRSRQGTVQLIDASGTRFWRQMRKSLGSKRREISGQGHSDILRLYQDQTNDGESAKMFNATDFGYREIRVERPLRLAFMVTPERLEALASDRALARLSEAERRALKAALVERLPGRFTSRDEFEAALSQALAAAGLKLAAPAKKAVIAAFAERDETADICRDAKGQPEPDPELRDHELVPLGEDWREYVAREVTPFVPDAWVDESYRDGRDGQVGRVGYEINFNRYFYKYVPPRPLEEIDAELKELELEIAGLLMATTR